MRDFEYDDESEAVHDETRSSMHYYSDIPQRGEGFSMKALGRAFHGLKDAYTGSLGTMARNLLPNADENGRPGFSGEMHAPLLLPNGRTGVANYMGPGTALVQRLKRGDPPRTETDKISQAHDLRYTLATSVEDIREADNRMIAKTDEVAAAGLDSKRNIVLANAIRAKKYAEDFSVLDREAFAADTARTYDDRGFSNEDVSMMKGKLAELEQEGYGDNDNDDNDDKKKKYPADGLKMQVIKDQIKALKKKEKENPMRVMSRLTQTKMSHNKPLEQAISSALQLASKTGQKYKHIQFDDPENPLKSAFQILQKMKSH